MGRLLGAIDPCIHNNEIWVYFSDIFIIGSFPATEEEEQKIWCGVLYFSKEDVEGTWASGWLNPLKCTSKSVIKSLPEAINVMERMTEA